jgi:hypothetical protein
MSKVRFNDGKTADVHRDSDGKYRVTSPDWMPFSNTTHGSGSTKSEAVENAGCRHGGVDRVDD